MTRILLAAGVAALAISAPAAARPGGGHGGGGGGQAAYTQHGGGGGGGGHQRAQSFNGGGGQAARQQRAPQMHAQRMQSQHFAAARPQHEQRVQMRAERTQHVNRTQTRVAQQQQAHGNNRAQVRMADRQQVRAQHVNNHVNDGAQNRMAARQQARDNRAAMANDHANNRMADRQQMRIDRVTERQLGGRLANNAVGYGVGGCPPGLAGKGCMPPGIARQQNLQSLRTANIDAFRASGIQGLMPGTRLLAPARVAEYVGQPLSALSGVVPLMALPQSVNYLYPETPDYYYRYGDGYLYQVDRGSNLIAALLPLLAGGYMPGQYLPASYMNSYVPSYYGLNSFYPASYGAGYGYGYDNLCNRYANGVVYQVDCYTGMIRDVVPTYGGGYGVGQLLPSAYTTYNVPYQYRSMYYDTPDYNYWYGPGAIYQYDPSSSLITSVAALLSPGFTVGQALPAGYGMYNVPLAYRGTYYDTPNAWYRYNNGYIYQVDPTTQLVSAIVASVLT